MAYHELIQELLLKDSKAICILMTILKYAEDKKYTKNFQWFDRVNDERISFTGLQELFTSIGYVFDEQELSELYKELEELKFKVSDHLPCSFL
ncbi:unnamed protein product (macronuclear) [Paramecium tetraurelia]|uniref:EF-hand domain-containing protein n=1 Tax=Paramecium tetraurelia TaxID=5888 RepID=A0C695_PARTE|nr:uncharacterized protein GSPATT00035441001 [Paramecium tetraurelia]CAK66312.1 unnamed protein product [Paramecium tetraurelia]|eukprot:XP_001433709.1 hypothetical protein (macronuclear) [Paramecium tetraurelia strain d4-2]